MTLLKGSLGAPQTLGIVQGLAEAGSGLQDQMRLDGAHRRRLGMRARAAGRQSECRPGSRSHAAESQARWEVKRRGRCSRAVMEDK